MFELFVCLKHASICGIHQISVCTTPVFINKCTGHFRWCVVFTISGKLRSSKAAKDSARGRYIFDFLSRRFEVQLVAKVYYMTKANWPR